MDLGVRDSKVNPIGDSEVVGESYTQKARKVDDDDEEAEESPLVPKDKRKVQWNDANGDKLAEIIEFFPSDGSESEDDDSDICFCTIM